MIDTSHPTQLYPLRYFSAFAGIGGFELGLDGHQCVGCSETDPHASRVYARHFPETRNYGDITRIDPARLPDFDLLTGGFPCQPFSSAGRRRGFADPRGTLFFDLARIAGIKRPPLLLLENVRGLLWNDRGRTFWTVLRTLDDLGYDLQWQVLDSQYFGVPQHRERVYVVGHLRGTPRPDVFPLRRTARQNPGLVNRGDRKPETSLTRREAGGAARVRVITGRPVRRDGRRSVEYRVSDRDTFPTLRASHFKTGDTQPRIMVNCAIRRLTPVECERLQGFPDGWIEGLSDTQRYRCLGNAVTVNVVRAVADRLTAAAQPPNARPEGG